MDVSVVIPAYNEAKIIGDTLDKVRASMERLGLDYEIVVADDGSTDGTADIAWSCGNGRVRVAGYGSNKGKGAAVRTGVMAAEGAIIICTDADLACGSPDDIDHGDRIFGRMFDMVALGGADVAAGSRLLDKAGYASYPVHRKIVSAGFRTVSRTLSGLPYDTQCGIKAYRREAARRIFDLCSTDGFAFDFEVLMLARAMGMKIGEVPVRVVNFRESKVRVVRDSARMFRDVLRIRRRVARYGKPW